MPDLQARYQNRLASAKIRDYLKEQLPQQDAGTMLTMATHPQNARGICRIGWKNVVKPIHLNATNLPLGDDFWRPIYRNIGDDLWSVSFLSLSWAVAVLIGFCRPGIVPDSCAPT